MATLELISDIDNSLSMECHNISEPERCGSIINKFPVKILHVNIRSMQRNFDSFLIILSRLGIVFDVIIMSECWIGPSSIIKQIDGYQSYCTEKYINRAGGVVAYVNEKWCPDVVEPDLDDANCLIVKVTGVFTVFGIYRSPSFVNAMPFLSALDCNLRSLSRCPCLVLVGDININIMESAIDDECTSIYLTLLSEHGLIPTIKIPTHNKTCIDHICVSVKASAESVVCPSDLTDHSIVMLGLTRSTKRPLRRTRLKIDLDGIKTELSNINWHISLNDEHLDDNVTKFSSLLSDAISRHSRTVKVSHSKFNIKPWMTPGLIRCSKHRDKLHAEHRKFPQDESKKLIYTRYRNFYISLLRRLKTDYERQVINENKKCPSKLWKSINQLSHRVPSKSKNNSQELLQQQNWSKQKSLDECNSYFCSIGQKLANTTLLRLNESQKSLAACVTNIASPSNSFFISPTDVEEVMDIIKKLDSKSSPGIDKINNATLKALKCTIAPPLAFLFNKSIESGSFPEAWKTAVVAPIHKSGSRSEVSNYRPISLLGSISKLLERIINKRLTSFLESNNLLTKRQFGFRRGRSTEDAVTLTTDIISSHLDNGRCCIGVFLDLAKAFDTVSVPILLKKLAAHGIRGTALKWFTGYLSNRTQCVRIGDYLSNLKPITFGVPQGSILGPTLFLLYINDICSVPVQNADFICYADDTALIFSDSSWDLVSLRTEIGMRLISEWLDRNLLKLNTEKTKFLCFSKTAVSAPITNLKHLKIHTCDPLVNIACKCAFITRTDTIRYLGVIIDEKLTFKQHISLTSSRVRKISYVMKNLRESADGSTLRSVYLALCQSLLTYCILAWGGAAKTYLVSLERAQRGVLKAALFKPMCYSTTALYEETGVLSVRKLFLLKAALHTHRSVLSAEEYKIMLTKRLFRIPVHATKTHFSQRFSKFLMPHIYNKLSTLLNFKNAAVSDVQKMVTKLLLGWSYDDAEDIIKVAK